MMCRGECLQKNTDSRNSGGEECYSTGLAPGSCIAKHLLCAWFRKHNSQTGMAWLKFYQKKQINNRGNAVWGRYFHGLINLEG